MCTNNWYTLYAYVKSLEKQEITLNEGLNKEGLSSGRCEQPFVKGSIEIGVNFLSQFAQYNGDAFIIHLASSLS